MSIWYHKNIRVDEDPVFYIDKSILRGGINGVKRFNREN
ncbi:hypothetical protein HMPREF0378_1050 [Eubacterium nodatum ATCC 33099]|nr:hypothetical protein HMPREF0378_1050 [Eubacterium nodatum ATCC 33099]